MSKETWQKECSRCGNPIPASMDDVDHACPPELAKEPSPNECFYCVTPEANGVYTLCAKHLPSKKQPMPEVGKCEHMWSDLGDVLKLAQCSKCKTIKHKSEFYPQSCPDCAKEKCFYHKVPEAGKDKEEWEINFDERFSPEWWKGFGTTDDIDKLGIEGIKDYFRNLIRTLTTQSYERGFKKALDEFKKSPQAEEMVKEIIAEARTQERERILKVLEEWRKKKAKCSCGCDFGDSCLCRERKSLMDDLGKFLKNI